MRFVRLLCLGNVRVQLRLHFSKHMFVLTGRAALYVGEFVSSLRCLVDAVQLVAQIVQSLCFAYHSVNTLVCICLEILELLLCHFMVQVGCLVEQESELMLLHLCFRHVDAKVFEMVLVLVIATVDLIDLTDIALVPSLEQVKLVRQRLELIYCGVSSMEPCVS